MSYEPWTRPPSERDIIIDKVKYGELTPDQAAQEADRLGLEPFEFYPNPADFEPTKEPTWSLPMTLAWIMWRTPDAVREMWTAYRQNCWRFIPRTWQVPGGKVYEGHWHENKAQAELLDLAIMTAQHPTPRGAPDDYSTAFQLLSTEAQLGSWMATGIPKDGGHRREILPFEWVDFQLCEQFHRLGIRMKRGSSGYDDCCFPVAGIVHQSFPAFAVGVRQRVGKRCAPASATIQAKRRLNPHLAHLSWDYRSFVAIAQSWSKVAKEPTETMLAALIAAFFEGEFERGGGTASAIFELRQPDGSYTSSQDVVFSVREDGKRCVSRDREELQWSRVAVADIFSSLGGFQWDKSSGQGPGALSTIPFKAYPKDFVQVYLPLFCVRRHDFIAWYSKWPPSMIPAESFWVDRGPSGVPIGEASHLDDRRAANGALAHPQTRGRKKGSGSYDGQDAPLLEKMRRLIVSEKVVSVEAAARKVAHNAFGTSDEASKRDRLAKKFRSRFGSDIARIKSDKTRIFPEH